MRLTAVLGLTGVIALSATGGPLAAQAGEQTVTRYGRFNFTPSIGVTKGLVNGPADSVYQHTRVILAGLGVPIKHENASARQLMSRRERVVRRIGKHPVSRYLTCGYGTTGPAADSWFVYLTIETLVTPQSARTSELTFSITAEAINVPEGRNESVACTTTGKLERALVDELVERFPET